MIFRHYKEDDYQAVCDFLIALNSCDIRHINWNWARFEWMYEHPEFDKSAVNSIGLWLDDDRVVGAAIYDMYFGEGFCGVLQGYESLYPDVLDYAYNKLRDDAGFSFAICDGDEQLIRAAEIAGFEPEEQSETMMKISLDGRLNAELPDGLIFAELDPVKRLYEFQWLLWQGFDHGTDKAEFERENGVMPEITRFRMHFDPRLSITAVDGQGEMKAYCCLWYSDLTDYAYVEPVCTVPDCRGKGVARAVIYEALNRAHALGAKAAYVISDMEFYSKLGFEKCRHFSFYRKK